jgi:glutaredoxin
VVLSAGAGLIAYPFFSLASDLPVIYLFHSEGCFHCQKERVFLEELKIEMPELKIMEYEVWHNEKNRKLFLEIAEKLKVKNPAVPFTVIGDKYLIGFDNPENSGQTIRQMIKNKENKETEIDLKSASLPFLAVTLGILDGFNPCSMWSLFVLLTLVIATGSKKKVWLVGSVFIITSAISYFLFMVAWLNAFVFLNYFIFTKIIIGIIALVTGIIFIKRFYTFKSNVCSVASGEKKEKIVEKIKKVLSSSKLPLLILGVAGVAFSVNLIELLCSLGIPVVFTKVLSMHNLASWKYYAYIAFYDFFYMLDDIVVLLIAGFSMRFFVMNDKYSRYSQLIAGILILVLGAIFLFKPEFLMFGR